MLGKNRKPSFTYKDGLRDGELGILDGNKFKSKDIVVFLLKEMGYSDTWIANSFVGMTEESVKSMYLQTLKYRDIIYNTKQQRAFARLMKAIKENDRL